MSTEASKSVFPLERVTPEILDLILTFVGISVEPITLWKCGSRALQHLLERSVTQIGLVNHTQLAFVTLPSILPLFRSLRTLEVDHRHYELQHSEKNFPIIRSLSPTLTRLSLKFASVSKMIVEQFLVPVESKKRKTLDNRMTEEDIDRKSDDGTTSSEIAEGEANAAAKSIENIQVPPSTDASSASTSTVPSRHTLLSACFPRLQQLEVVDWGAIPLKCFALLPDTLTELVANPEYAREYCPPTTMPSQLRRLVANGEEISLTFFQSLPAQLEHLQVGNVANTVELDHIRALPRSLLSLTTETRYENWPFNGGQLQALPPGLTSLRRTGPGGDMDDFCRNLPATLTDIELDRDHDLFPEHLRLLPRAMKSIGCRIDAQGLTDKDLPPSLTTLRAHIGNASDNFFALLPSSILDLEIYLGSATIKPSCFKQIPSITHLTVYAKTLEDEEFTFPPALTSMTLGFDNCPKTLPTMPESLKKLSLAMLIDYTSLVALPPRLCELSLRQLTHPDLFDPNDTTMQARIALLRDVGQQEGFCEVASTARPVNVWDLLPRTLKSLSIDLGETNPFEQMPEVWSALPRNLKSIGLSVSSGAISEESFAFLPLESLSSTIRLGHEFCLRNEQLVKRLHPKLRDFYIETELAPECARFIPPTLRWDMEAFKQLSEQRSEALKNNDRDAFNALMARE